MAYIDEFVVPIGDRVKGRIYRPNKELKPIPVIIFCHGWASDRTFNPSTAALCEEALQKNVAMVAFDFFGCGETGGDYGQMSYGRWKDNLATVVDWLEEQPWVDSSKIGCFAISSGTTVAIRLAQEDERLAYVISVATCISTHINMGTGGPTKQLMAHMDELKQGGTAELFKQQFKLDFFLDTVGEAPVLNLDQIKCPVYFLQGGSDNVFRRTDAQIGYEMMQYYQLETDYDVIEGGDHGLGNVPKECTKHVMGWLDKMGMI